MRRIAQPLDSAADVFAACVSIVKSNELKGRLHSVVGTITAAEAEFEVAATNANLHNLATQADVAGVVSIKEMSEVYEYRMVRAGTPGRLFYDKLMSSPSHGLCPLCGQRVVSTLDHHLAKTQYPALAVTPLNLVPACMDCNKIKLAQIPKTAEEQTLHPYFDNIEAEQWLYAEIITSSPAALRFYIQAPDGALAVQVARVRHHFSLFGLGRLYAAHAGAEIVNIRRSLERIFATAGSLEVKAHLQDQASSYAVVDKNSWQTAMYAALAENDWFCQIGFRP